MSRKKLDALRRAIRRLRLSENVTGQDVQRLARAIRRRVEVQDKSSAVYIQRVLAVRPPLRIPKVKILTSLARDIILDIVEGDLDAYEETFDPPNRSTNGRRRK
jgi:hypothetical protein